jgi:hypothetical protein
MKLNNIYFIYFACPQTYDTRKFSKEEMVAFEKKFSELKKLENIDRVVGFIFSRSGFTKDAEDYCKEKGIACSEDEMWLETGS